MNPSPVLRTCLCLGVLASGLIGHAQTATDSNEGLIITQDSNEETVTLA
jgi:hypothetical protein